MPKALLPDVVAEREGAAGQVSAQRGGGRGRVDCVIEVEARAGLTNLRMAAVAAVVHPDSRPGALGDVAASCDPSGERRLAMSTASLGSRRGGWQRPVAVPPDLAGLRGSLTGMVRLPLRVYSSGAGPHRVFDLADEAERIELYQIVLTDGSTEDICAHLNEHGLRRLWPRLWLPPHVRRAWQPHPTSRPPRRDHGGPSQEL